MTIELYKNNSDKNYIDKYITLVTTLTGTLRDSCDIVNPVIMIEYNTVIDFNYVFITEFNRYYYLVSATVDRNNMWTISLRCDVLMSFKTKIKLLNVLIKRTSDSRFINPLLVDSNAVKLTEKTITEYECDISNADFEFFEEYDLWDDTNADIYTIVLTKAVGIPQP